MAKTNRRPVDKLERKQRLDQRSRDTDTNDWSQRQVWSQMYDEDESEDQISEAQAA